MRIVFVGVFFVWINMVALAQDYRWQQQADYNMDVHLDVKHHKVTGTQKLIYYNNSRDTLDRVFYHLYFNAFQPGSMMDVRSRNISDPDRRVTDRISKLSAEEIGYQHIDNLKQDGKKVNYNVEGTIMEVQLAKPILPGSKSVFELKFESQVPLQIRRSGRNNKEGIDYTMTQWYPKIAEYDFQGWHAYQYVAREFHGVWGNYDVKITLDSSYTIGGTGILQNPEQIGHGYVKSGTKIDKRTPESTWHFMAKNVIDFAWAADPDYVHETAQVPNGALIHFFYQPGQITTDNWKRAKEYAVKHMQAMNKIFGKYPYEQYSIIQGGDGGMEYPMCTMITGERTSGSLSGVIAHEMAHSWYQAVLASNEALHSWMDEGFASFAGTEISNAIFDKQNDHQSSYQSYYSLVKNGLQEPADQHSDHYSTNKAYTTASYSMGVVFLHQLKYIIGTENFYKGMRRYYNEWKFHHPEPIDFIRVMEKVSGLQLKWYLSYWFGTTKHIDYGIESVVDKDGGTLVTLTRIGEFPMPIDLFVIYTDGTSEIFYVPLNETLGNKPIEYETISRNDLEAWQWVDPKYTVRISKPTSEISYIVIDPSMRMADIDPSNNVLELNKLSKPAADPDN